MTEFEGTATHLMPTYQLFLQDSNAMNDIYLPNYANPCWYEQYPNPVYNLYGNNCILTTQAENFQQARPQAVASAQHKLELQEVDIMSKGRGWRLQCLPKVFILGVDKGGANELSSAVKQHPLLDNGHFRESALRFWTDMRGACE